MIKSDGSSSLTLENRREERVEDKDSVIMVEEQ